MVMVAFLLAKVRSLPAVWWFRKYLQACFLPGAGFFYSTIMNRMNKNNWWWHMNFSQHPW